jgi:hypothetical protein
VDTVLTIAAAQQRTKPEVFATTAYFKILDINLGQLVPSCSLGPADDTPNPGGSDDEEGDDAEETDESGDEPDGKAEPEFIDLDPRDGMQVRFDVGPDKLLKSRIARLPDTVDGSTSQANPLEGAIHDGDFEAFIQIIEINAKLPKPVTLTDLVSEDTFLQKDRAKLLDEYIRRTGQGIEAPRKNNEGTEDAPQRPKGKEYWGLNVHGKKRRDLASRGDPNSRFDTRSKIPLVWSAAQSGALGVLEYLNTDRPLAAYQYYFSANAKESKDLDLQTLEGSISDLLGWCSNPSDETALSAAVKSGRLDSFKKLLELNPTLLKPYFHKRYVTRVL